MLGEVVCTELIKNLKKQYFSILLCIFAAMVNKKAEKYKNQLIVYPENYDKEGELVDDSGQTIQALDIWEYCRFFADYIQLKTDDLYDGIDLMSFSDKHGFLFFGDNKKIEQQKAFMDKLFSFTADGRVCNFQKEMESYYNIRINAMALCTLCLFINDIIHSKLVVLLKPSLKDVADSIDSLKSVTFTNEDGSSISSDNKLLLTKIKKVIQQEYGNEYEAYRIADRMEVFTIELLQIEFFYYISHFLNKYFQFKRIGLLTNEELNIIGYFMKWFGLSSKEVSYSRLRQLRMKFDKVGMGDIFAISLNGKEIKLQWQFIKYSDWSKGKINPLNKEINAIGDIGTITIPSDIDGLDLLKR